MKNRFRFLFDTWYGALALWGGACVVFLAFLAFDVFLLGRLPRALAIFAALSMNGGKDASITCDLSSLAGLVRDRRADLMAYLARHPGWWLHEYRGQLCATRKS